MKKNLNKLLLLFTVVFGFLIQPVQAQTLITVNTKASAQMVSTCTISATNITFGTYIATNGDYTNQGTFSLLCTKGTSVSIGTERNPGVDTANCPSYTISFCYPNGVRYMSDGKGNVLYYNLFQSSTMNSNTVIPGNSWYVGNAYITAKATGVIQNIPFFAGLAGGQYSPPGSYSDTVTATVNF